jgi:hypothetical protein
MTSSGSHFRLGALLARKPQLSVYAVKPVGLLVGVAALLLLAWVLLYAVATPRRAEMDRIAGQLAHQFQVTLISACVLYFPRWLVKRLKVLKSLGTNRLAGRAGATAAGQICLHSCQFFSIGDSLQLSPCRTAGIGYAG